MDCVRVTCLVKKWIGGLLIWFEQFFLFELIFGLSYTHVLYPYMMQSQSFLVWTLNSRSSQTWTWRGCYICGGMTRRLEREGNVWVSYISCGMNQWFLCGLGQSYLDCLAFKIELDYISLHSENWFPFLRYNLAFNQIHHLTFFRSWTLANNIKISNLSERSWIHVHQ